MARGQQKIQSQQKNQKKADAARKAGIDQKAAAAKALNHKCSVCLAMMPDQRHTSSISRINIQKSPLPAELVDVAA
ncbi:hypothetical protein CRE_14123 [Caenorhabditis remanei]|uniref:Small EDRK-rich factor-like N-terminal domain-containing protein n=1 Tax=Caenorhabditis remanei TaxID=31234 RepID=E3MRC7_CAERE|nr:hypothetical protein CRE_14123 [Caenorhabditis remanei]